jgi:hypothetical protein
MKMTVLKAYNAEVYEESQIPSFYKNQQTQVFQQAQAEEVT